MGHIPNLVLQTLKAGFPNLWNSVDSVFRQHFVILTTLVFQKLKFLFPWVQNYELKIILSYSKHKPMHYYWLKTICQPLCISKHLNLKKIRSIFAPLCEISARASHMYRPEWALIENSDSQSAYSIHRFPYFRVRNSLLKSGPTGIINKVWISLWLVRFVIIPLNEKKKSSFETANISLSIKGRGW